MRLYIEEAPTMLGLVAVKLGIGDMTEAKADAYVVPQFKNCSSEGGVAASIGRAGAHLGIADEYEAIVRNGGGTLKFGAAFVTPSHGGKTSSLIHVVSVASGPEKEFNVVNQAVYNALTSASIAGLKQIVCPILGTGIIGALTDEQSAKAMLSGANRFAMRNPDAEIEITFVVYGNPASLAQNPTVAALKRALVSKSYLEATPVVGQRELDVERWRDEMQRDIDLGTIPPDPVEEVEFRGRKRAIRGGAAEAQHIDPTEDPPMPTGPRR